MMNGFGGMMGGLGTGIVYPEEGASASLAAPDGQSPIHNGPLRR